MDRTKREATTAVHTERVATYDDLPVDGAPGVVYLVLNEGEHYINGGVHPESFYQRVDPNALPTWFTQS